MYQPDSTVSVEVRLEDENVWLNRQQIAVLFDRDIKTIGKHINNALSEELAVFSTGAQHFWFNDRQMIKNVMQLLFL